MRETTPYYTNSLPSAGGLYRGLFSLRLIFRMICRRCTPSGTVISCVPWTKNCRTRKAAAFPCAEDCRELQTAVLHARPRRILFVRTTAISPASILHVRSVEKRQRFTAVSRDITVRSRTGTTENARSTRTELYMISSTPNRRSRK